MTGRHTHSKNRECNSFGDCRPFYKVFIDFSDPYLMGVHGKRHTLMIRCASTAWGGEGFTTARKTEATQCTTKANNEFVGLLRMRGHNLGSESAIRVVQSDGAKELIEGQFKEMCRQHNIHQVRTTPYVLHGG